MNIIGQSENVEQNKNFQEETSNDSTNNLYEHESIDVNQFLNLDNNVQPKLEEQNDYNQAQQQQLYQLYNLQANGNQLRNNQPINLNGNMIGQSNGDIQLLQQQMAEEMINQQKIHKMNQKARMITKREKAKQIRQKKQIQLDSHIIQTNDNPDWSSSEISKQDSKSTGKKSDTTDEIQVQKKQDQKIRNRISAQNSRDKKKAYILKLENENKRLEQENVDLHLKIQQLLNDNLELKKANEILKLQSEQQGNKMGVVSDYFNDPDKSDQISSRTQFGIKNTCTIGLGFLLLVCIILCNNMASDKTLKSPINLIQSLKVNDQLQQIPDKIQPESEKIGSDSEIFSILEKVNQIEKQQSKMDNTDKDKIQQELTYHEEQQQQTSDQQQVQSNKNFLMKYNEKPAQSENHSGSEELGLVDYYSQSTVDNKSILVVPKMYKYQSKINKNFKIAMRSDDKIQLFIPQNEFYLYYRGDDGSYYSQNYYGMTSENNYLEIMAKIETIKEINLQQMQI